MNQPCIANYTLVKTVSGQLPPRKIVPRLELGFQSRIGLVLGLGQNQAIAPEDNYPLVRVRVWVRISFGVGGWGWAIFLRGNCRRTGENTSVGVSFYIKLKLTKKRNFIKKSLCQRYFPVNFVKRFRRVFLQKTLKQPLLEYLLI